METKTGIVSGIVATISLATIQLWLGLTATAITIVCLLPNAIMNWRNLRKEYAEFLKREDESHSPWLFIKFCIVRL